MKKVVFLVALALGLGMTKAQAQEVFGGIKADANMSNFILNDMDEMKSKVGFGATIGGYTKIGLGEKFALQPEILLHYKNSKMEVEASGKETDFQYFGVELPVYAVLQTGNFFIGAGPYLGLGIDARYKASGASDVELYKEYNNQK